MECFRGNKRKSGRMAILLSVAGASAVCAAAADSFLDWAETPTMGWNSWDFYGTTVTEEQTKAQADYMAEHLLAHGWDLITVDIQWYAPSPEADGDYYNYDTANADLVMDEYGRLLPAITRFPSAADGNGFKALADYVHSKGLRFGIHMMRGIPKQAVIDDLPIYGTEYTASQIADTGSTCSWNPDMYGVDMSQPGAQEFYNSLYNLYASWGVDFVKIDDLSRPYDSVQQAEVEAIRAAIDQCGRPMVFSTSPGETPLSKGEHVMQNANQWRISDDFWDSWNALYDQFERLHNWTPYRGAGHFPDADMLPMGKLHASSGDTDGRDTYFSSDELYTMMSLWSIARSPLIHGGDMTQMDTFTLSLMTNDEVIAVNQYSTHNRQLFQNNDLIAWVADATDSSNKYLAVFNATESRSAVSVDLTDLGYNGDCSIRSLWDQSDLGTYNGTFAPTVNSHGAALYSISGAVISTPWLSSISADDGVVELSWEIVDSAASYSVKRALSEDGVFTTIASGLTGTSYADSSVENGTVYYYAVSAMIDGEESPDSNVRYDVPASGIGIVSWNWNSYGDSPTDVSAAAGVEPVAVSFWNDSWIDAGNDGSAMSDLRDSTGATSPVDINWSTIFSYQIQGSHPGADSDGSYSKEILNGYLNSGGESSSSITFSQIPYDMYDIYVYFSSDVAGREGNISDGTSTYYFNAMGAASVSSANAVFVQATNTTTAGYDDACNYAVFSGLTGPDQTVSCSIPAWGGIAAIQLVGRRTPSIHSVSVTNGAVALNWTADAYGTYQIQGKGDLTSTNGWSVVLDGLSGGTSNNVGFSLSSDQAFFRIRGE